MGVSVNKHIRHITWFIVSFGFNAKTLATSGPKTEALASSGLEANISASAFGSRQIFGPLGRGRDKNLTYCTLLLILEYIISYTLVAIV